MNAQFALGYLTARLESIQGGHHRHHSEVSPEFSAFEALRPGENALSRMLVYLLDPDKEHGQGCTFLDAFLQLIGSPAGPFVHIDPEWRCTQLRDPQRAPRRIDVLLRVGEDVIAIENKPWAGEQVLQCSDYARELSSIAGDH